jgi:alpha-amylase/alpha-mannosidase (GH57 family)
MERYVCIHGHFYQPPRENPWLEAIELQDAAYPYHDWNERINAECYAPNSVSRILDESNRIVRLLNNYAKISFNFGPTLLSWLEAKSPDVYQAILDADKESRKNFSGHGSALAQAYVHMIFPLANARDRYTQALWGIRDFEQRFKRAPEGMWLPETAVDLETLEILAEMGIKFPFSRPIRRGGYGASAAGRGKMSAAAGSTRRAPMSSACPRGGKSRCFYDGPVSAPSPEGLLSHGEHFADASWSVLGGARRTAIGAHRHRR